MGYVRGYLAWPSTSAWQPRFRFGNHASDKVKGRLSTWLTRTSQCARGVEQVVGMPVLHLRQAV